VNTTVHHQHETRVLQPALSWLEDFFGRKPVLLFASVKVNIILVRAELVSQAPHVKARVHEHCWQINCAGRNRG
jgi:hypothetical protein